MRDWPDMRRVHLCWRPGRHLPVPRLWLLAEPRVATVGKRTLIDRFRHHPDAAAGSVALVSVRITRKPTEASRSGIPRTKIRS